MRTRTLFDVWNKLKVGTGIVVYEEEDATSAMVGIVGKLTDDLVFVFHNNPAWNDSELTEEFQRQRGNFNFCWSLGKVEEFWIVEVKDNNMTWGELYG